MVKRRKTKERKSELITKKESKGRNKESTGNVKEECDGCDQFRGNALYSSVCLYAAQRTHLSQ